MFRSRRFFDTIKRCAVPLLKCHISEENRGIPSPKFQLNKLTDQTLPLYSSIFCRHGRGTPLPPLPLPSENKKWRPKERKEKGKGKKKEKNDELKGYEELVFNVEPNPTIFDVDEKNLKKRFLDFQKKLRDLLRGQRSINGVKILTWKEHQNPYLNIILESEEFDSKTGALIGQVLTLKVRKCDAYLVAYRFGRGEIEPGESIDSNHKWNCLRASARERVAETDDIEGILSDFWVSYDREDMMDSRYVGLSILQKSGREFHSTIQQRKNLLSIIVHILESARFVDIGNYIAEHDEGNFLEEHKVLIRSWGSLSDNVRYHHYAKKTFAKEVKGYPISFEKTLKILGLIKAPSKDW